MQDPITVPRETVHDLITALDLALMRIEVLDPDPAIVTKQLHAHGQQVLDTAKRTTGIAG